MASIKVYRYDFYDPVLKRDRRSVDYATADVIGKMGGTILVETEQTVEEDLLEAEGTIRATNVFLATAAGLTRARGETRRAA
jgi:hypothetical protein